MRYSLPYIPLTGVALAVALLIPAPLAPRALARPAVPHRAGMVMHLQISGGYRYTGTISHAEDAGYGVPAKYACVRFTHPNFASRRRPLAYALSFDNPGVSAATGGVFFAFYYTPTVSGYQRVDDKNANVTLFVVPAAYKSFAPGGVGTYKIMVKLAPDGRSGTFKATNLRNIVGTENHVDVVGSWSCPTVFVRPT